MYAGETTVDDSITVVLTVTTTVLLMVLVYSTSFPSEAVDVETLIAGPVLVNG